MLVTVEDGGHMGMGLIISTALSGDLIVLGARLRYKYLSKL